MEGAFAFGELLFGLIDLRRSAVREMTGIAKFGQSGNDLQIEFSRFAVAMHVQISAREAELTGGNILPELDTGGIVCGELLKSIQREAEVWQRAGGIAIGVHQIRKVVMTPGYETAV